MSVSEKEQPVKFSFSEKATKNCAILFFVDFSEKLNFTNKSTYLLKRLDLYECGCLDPISTTDWSLAPGVFKLHKKSCGCREESPCNDGRVPVLKLDVQSSLNIASVIWSYVHTYVASGR